MCSCLCIIYLLMFTFYFYFVLLCTDICPCSCLWFWWLEVNIEQVRRVLKQTWQETSYYHKTCVLTDCFLGLLAPSFQKDKVQLDSSFLTHLSWESLPQNRILQLLGLQARFLCSTWLHWWLVCSKNQHVDGLIRQRPSETYALVEQPTGMEVAASPEEIPISNSRLRAVHQVRMWLNIEHHIWTCAAKSLVLFLLLFLLLSVVLLWFCWCCWPNISKT